MGTKPTLLKYLKEGDEFKFYNDVEWMPFGNRLSIHNYYVEGQYPYHKCTTICRKADIRPCGTGLHMTNVYSVDNDALVIVVKRQAIHICHKVNLLK